MFSLPPDLDHACSQLFNDCQQFASTGQLRALCTTSELQPFANQLPDSSGHRSDRVQAVKAFLLEKRLADGRSLLLPFLLALRNQHPEADSLYGELDDLYRRVRQHLHPKPPAAPPSIALNQYFLCYAPRDGQHHAQRLRAALRQVGLPAWLDSADTPAGYDPDAARESALRDCAAVLLLLTPGSAASDGESATEWQRALRFKKPIVPLRFAAGLELPLGLGRRAPLSFVGDWEAAVAALRRHLEGLPGPEGQLRELEYRRADAERELRHAPSEQRASRQQEIDQLEAAIARQRAIVRDPQAAARQTEQRIASGLERERQPEHPTAGRAATRFINPPPLTAPSYFQDRHVENGLIADFLRDPAKRLLTVVGRGGVGKTALVCRLLKALENGRLPDDLGDLPVRGIVYLSAVGARAITFPNLFADLLKLLPTAQRPALEAAYKEPQSSVAEKLWPIWAAFRETVPDYDPQPVILLLDNLEELLDPASHAFREAEVVEALLALLDAPPHSVKAILTSRLLPPGLRLHRPERQMTLPLDDGLPSPYAEAVLRAGDPTGALRLRNASDAALAPASAYTRGFPRALEALTAALDADRSATLAELLAGPPPENVVMALVGEAYSRLDKMGQQVMQALAIFGRPVPAAAVDYLLQPTRHDIDSAPTLNRLVNSRFATKEAGRYYLHPVDREYALARVPQKDDQRITGAAPPYTQRALLARAADYYRQARKPQAAWQTLDDLAPQLAEFDLRCAAEAYDAAADVLTDIDFSYLRRWGHVRLMARLHEQLQGKIQDSTLACVSAGRLGIAYYILGSILEAIACYKQALTIAHKIGDRHSEGAWLGNLGLAYADLGRIPEAIEHYKQALTIAREIGRQHDEGNYLGNLGNAYAALGRTSEAIEHYEQTLTIAREIGDRHGEGARLGNLAWTLLAQGDLATALTHAQESVRISEEVAAPHLVNYHATTLALIHASIGAFAVALAVAEMACSHDCPTNNATAQGARGIALLRLGRPIEARAAFQTAVVAAEAVPGHTALYAQLDALGVARCGLALAEPGQREAHLAAAAAAFRAARAITAAPGVVADVRRRLALLAAGLEGLAEEGVKP